MAAITALAMQPTFAGAYSNGFPSSPDFFPLAVWLQSPRNAPEFQAMGINTFVGLWHGPTEAQLSDLAKNHMFAVAEQNDAALASPNRSVIKAWMQADEPDNAQTNGHGGYDDCVPAADVAARTAAIRSRDPSRPVLINFGQGVADPTWIGRGTKCFGDLDYYGSAARDAGILSFDVYPVASANPHLQGKLEFVGRGVDNLKHRVSNRQSVWAILETTSLDDHHLVTPNQLRSEVWMALIHGASGIVYFVHEWTGGLREDGIFRHPEIVGAATAINRTILELAPVLNGPNATNGIAVSDPGVAFMAKTANGFLYVFAASEHSTGLTVTFSLTDLHSIAASVIGENRSVSLIAGKMTDNFEGYGVHLYKIPITGGH
ncbi:MAG TPA: hypothetical protein VNU97_12760 [Rhizomicrobium sp.]|nr:hypothetical protein [Rhizomicrobium sp.]